MELLPLLLEEHDSDPDIVPYFLLGLGDPGVHFLPPTACLHEGTTWEGSRREETDPIVQGCSGPLRDTCPVPAVSGNGDENPVGL